MFQRMESIQRNLRSAQSDKEKLGTEMMQLQKALEETQQQNVAWLRREQQLQADIKRLSMEVANLRERFSTPLHHRLVKLVLSFKQAAADTSCLCQPTPLII